MKAGPVLALLPLAFSTPVRVPGPNPPPTPPPFSPHVVLYDQTLGYQHQHALQVCAGLYNRPDTPGYIIHPDGVYVTSDPDDWFLKTLYNYTITTTHTVDEFIKECLDEVATGVIVWDSTTQQTLLPNIVALAAVRDAVPIDKSSTIPSNLDKYPVVYDAIVEWAGYEPRDATEDVWDTYGTQFTGLSKQNPGYEKKELSLHPAVVGTPNPLNMDWVVSQKLFNFFLVAGCVPLTAEHRLFTRIAGENTFVKPTPVYGYDDSIELGGELYEAETNCIKEHNLGQIASSGTPNLSFFKRWEGEIDTTPAGNPDGERDFEGKDVYVTFVVGDGDNLNVILNRNKQDEFMGNRRELCSGDGAETCFPLVWTYNPNAFEIIPRLTAFMFDFVRGTGRDYFMMPPSGHLYAYPATMDEESRGNYVEVMEEDFELMGSRATIHWEWFYSWISSVDKYFSRFGSKGPVGFFLTTVPYMFPMPLFFQSEDYKIVGEQNNVVLFKSNEWRGTGGGRSCDSVADMADKVNKLAGGSILHIYGTSDGGFNVDDFQKLAELLDERVHIVNAETLIEMVMQKEALAKR